jgi:hypothetical protein
MANGLEIRAKIDAETAKALLFINGGGVVVMLPLVPFFLQQPGRERIASAILGGVLILTLGLFFAVLHNRRLRRCSLDYQQNEMRPTPWTFIGIRFPESRACVFSTLYLRLSLGAFVFAGCLVTIYGLHVLRHL